MTERTKIARELAVKGGYDWETLSPEMVNAYLHNADQFIEERSREPVDEVDPKPMYTCDRCQDKAYIGLQRCLECNPVGLPAEEVYPVLELVGRVAEVKVEEGHIEVVAELTPEGKAKLGRIGLEAAATVTFAAEAGEGFVKVTKGKPHQHYYRKDGTCQCGQVKRVKKAK